MPTARLALCRFKAVICLLLLLLLLLGAAPLAQAQCGPLPLTWPVTAGRGALNLNGSNVVNRVTVSGSTGASVTMGGSRTSAYPMSFPALQDVSSSATVKLNNWVVPSGGSYAFKAGNYLITGASIGTFATLTVQPGTRIYLQGNFDLGAWAQFNTNGQTEHGQVFLYPNGNLTLQHDAMFRGVIYSPGSGNNINAYAGATITGAIIVNGGVALNGVTVALSSADQTALAAISTCADTTAPRIDSATLGCGANNIATVVFSERVQQASAETASNYTIPGVSVSSATLGTDLRSVTLQLASAITSTKTLSISNVADLAGNLIPSGSNLSLSPTTLYPGLYGSYYNQNGHSDAHGTYAFTGTAANRVDSTLNFDWGTQAPGVGSTPADGFSVRWSGVIKAKAAGSYGFATGSDDGVRFYLDSALLIDNFSDHSYTVDTSATRPTLAAGSYVPMVMEFYENTTDAVAQLGWQEPGQSGSTYYIIPAANLFNCTAGGKHLSGFSLVPNALTGSTCAAQTLTLTAQDSSGAALSSYTGTVTLSTSSGHGSWAKGSSPAPGGTLVDNGNGSASYTFVAADGGVAKFSLSHGLAQDVIVTATDSSTSPSTTANTSAIQFRDNAFVFAEDLSARVAGSDIAVVGRPHDMTLSLVKKDVSSGACGVATDYTGSHALKLWRNDLGGSYGAPSIGSPALSIPASQPASNNLTLSFASGVASFNLSSSDQGRYSLNVRDDSLSATATAISGASNALTVRPFALVVRSISAGNTANPNGAAASDPVFTAAGGNFSATVAAYAWSSAMLSNGADPNNAGSPSASASLSALQAGGLVSSFASSLSLSPLAGSQTPSGGTLGTLNNGTLAANSFSGGSATASNLQYTEVGSFALNTSGVVSNYLGSGLALDAVVVNAAGQQNTRVGRFVPAGFKLSNASLSHRSASACNPASSFTYLGEPFRWSFTLTAQNAQGATTSNYTGSYAKLALDVPANFGLAGISGSTVFKTDTTSNTSPARLSLGSSSGSWSQGVASNISLSATAERAISADGPFSASFGIAAMDSDGVTMLSSDLDTNSPADGVDHTALGSVALRLGRLRLANAIGSQQRPLAVPLTAQYWDGSGWATNTQDSCTQLPAAAVNLGNLRKSLSSADASLASPTSGNSLTLSAGLASLLLNAPASGHFGTLDLALSLGSSATDASCLQSWAPARAATAGAALAYLRGAWCGSSMDKDPAARASFGLYQGNNNLIDLREAY